MTHTPIRFGPTRTRSLALLCAVPILAVGLTGCGMSGSGGGSPASSSMSDMPTPSSSIGATGSPTGSATGSATAAAEVLIGITDFTYEVPASVAPGATISVRNGDSQAHTVTSKEGGFDAKVDPKGTVTFTAPTKPGRYAFVCSFHANMKGTLVVK